MTRVTRPLLPPTLGTSCMLPPVLDTHGPGLSLPQRPDLSAPRSRFPGTQAPGPSLGHRPPPPHVQLSRNRDWRRSLALRGPGAGSSRASSLGNGASGPVTVPPRLGPSLGWEVIPGLRPAAGDLAQVNRSWRRRGVHPHLYTARVSPRHFPCRGAELREAPRAVLGTARASGVQRPRPSPHLPLELFLGPRGELVPSRAAPGPDPDPGLRALAAEFRPKRREECRRVTSSEAEKRLRSGPARPPRAGPGSPAGLGSSVLSPCSAAWLGSRKTTWASGPPRASSRWYTRILRPDGGWGERAQAGIQWGLSSLPLPCDPGHQRDVPERKTSVFARIFSQSNAVSQGVGRKQSSWLQGAEDQEAQDTHSPGVLRQVTCFL